MKTAPKVIYLTFVLVALVCFALASEARATCQDGCLTNNNTAQGDDALISNPTGESNTATGHNALKNDTSGGFNTATGAETLANNTTGERNTATGLSALQSNTTGSHNTANGNGALYINQTANEITAIGDQALFNNAVDNSTAIGANAMYNNTSGEDNTAVGFSALSANQTGFGNTAVGVIALSSTTAANNTGVGAFALQHDTTGFTNTAMGQAALLNNSSGFQNTALGAAALINNTTGSNNISIGNTAGQNLTTGSSNIDIGNSGVAAESKTIRVGTKTTHRATYIAGISGATVPAGIAVIVDANGHLGTSTSSGRFKEAIKPMDKASEALLSLQPVTFRYKKELDPDAVPQFGLVAEDVAKVDPDLVARDEEGKPYTVRYEAVNAMLLNEFLKEHKKTEEQADKIQQLETALKQQTDQLQAVTARIEAEGL